jgi:hypothetical protein
MVPGRPIERQGRDDMRGDPIGDLDVPDHGWPTLQSRAPHLPRKALRGLVAGFRRRWPMRPCVTRSEGDKHELGQHLTPR